MELFSTLDLHTVNICRIPFHWHQINTFPQTIKTILCAEPAWRKMKHQYTYYKVLGCTGVSAQYKTYLWTLTYFLIITGHCGLNQHMNHLKLRDTDMCRFFNDVAEMQMYMIYSCPALEHKRRNLRKLILGPNDAKHFSATKLVLFLAATGIRWAL